MTKPPAGPYSRPLRFEMRFAAPFLLIIVIAAGVSGQNKYEKDFQEFWTSFQENFAYFDKNGIDWPKAREIYQPQAANIKSDREFVQFLERITHEFHNGHITLNTNLDSSNRIIPSGTDIWAEVAGDGAIIKDIREQSKAERSGLKPGMRIVRFNDGGIKAQLAQFLPRSVNKYTPRMLDYAVNMLLAGTHDQPRKITVETAAANKDFYPDQISTLPSENRLLESKILDRNIGYIKIHNSLFNFDLIERFDAALDSLITTRGLILDLTETPSGGNTTVARALMGRFIERETAYQKHSLPREERQFGVKRSWLEYVSPRGRIYRKPLIVMVSRWTGSMGEGLAIGFDAMKRGKIVGTRMAGLIGAIYSFQLSETKIRYSIPTEKLFQPNGAPREDFVPPYLTENTEQTRRTALRLAKGN
jgi:C-terminal processing protease CtpA/Prc